MSMESVRPGANSPAGPGGPALDGTPCPVPRPGGEPTEVQCGTVTDLWAPLTVHVDGSPDRLRVRVVGEADLSAAPTLGAVLSDAVRRTEALDVDLSGVAFMDCSGLNCLLRARALARARGTAFTVTAAPPAVLRLLGLTRTLSMLGPGPADGTPGC
jgi:anti-anti-sigma factor